MKTFLLLLILPILYNAKIESGTMYMHNDVVENCTLKEVEILSLGNDTLRNCILEGVAILNRSDLVLDGCSIYDTLWVYDTPLFINCVIVGPIRILEGK